MKSTKISGEIVCLMMIIISARFAIARLAGSPFPTDEKGSVHHHQREVLGADGRVVIEWDVHFTNETIIFQVTGQTTGYVGFGLSPSGGMAGSDIVIGGIHPNGTSYFSDYHGQGNFRPVRDDQQDWTLIFAFQNETSTALRFHRRWDTCDPNDVRITHDSLSLIWALGRTDEISYHDGERASIAAVTLLDPPPPIIDTLAFKSWRTTVNVVMQAEYAYRCSIRRGPKFQRRTHAVGFRPILEDHLASKYTHHFSTYLCKAPPEEEPAQLYERYADGPDDDCYTRETRLPIKDCLQVVYMWCPGETGTFFPPNVGYKFNPTDESYFMLEVHYENPQNMSGLEYKIGLEILYTESLRKYDAGFMTVAQGVGDSLLIPPRTANFLIEGRCSSECTEATVPPQGIHIMSVMLHAHLYAKKIRLRHFREDYELPWIAADDNYHFNSQKMRALRKERRVLPRDNFVLECSYNSTSRSNVLTGGFFSSAEMCNAFIWYYPKIELEACSSQFPEKVIHHLFGYNGHLINNTFANFLDEHVSWDAELKNEIQAMLMYENHYAACSPLTAESEWFGIAPPQFIDDGNAYQPTASMCSDEERQQFL